MKVIGIVGGIGSGKSTVVALMQEISSAKIISSDLVGHRILLKGQAGYLPVIEKFGQGILDSSGEINRKKLGEQVFKSEDKIKCLNAITHPIIIEAIRNEIIQQRQTEPSRYIILESALLLETELVNLTDCIIGVYTDVETRIARVIERDQLTKEHILKRIEMQKQWEEIKVAADYIIDNSFSLSQTKKQVEEVIRELKEREENNETII